MPEAYNLGSREHYSIKLNIFLFWLKQYGYKNNIFCIFVKIYENDFIMIAIYVERWNSWRASKIINLFKEKIWNERSWENKFLALDYKMNIWEVIFLYTKKSILHVYWKNN